MVFQAKATQKKRKKTDIAADYQDAAGVARRKITSRPSAELWDRLVVFAGGKGLKVNEALDKVLSAGLKKLTGGKG